MSDSHPGFLLRKILLATALGLVLSAQGCMLWPFGGDDEEAEPPADSPKG